MSNNAASKKANYKGNWETPWKHFEIIRKPFHFHLDVCADEKNTKCLFWISERENALSMPWVVPNGRYWWCNPDFSKATEFIEHAHKQMAAGHPGIMLLPMNLETEWFRSGITDRGIRILHYPQRIQFKDPEPEEGKKRAGNTKGSILAAFTLQEELPKVAGQPWWRTC